VPREHRAERRGAGAQPAARALVGVLGDAAPVAEAEDVAEEQPVVLHVRLDEHDVGGRVGVRVVLERRGEARVDERAEGLREHRRQPVLDQRPALLGGAVAAQLHRDDRVDAQQQVDALPERHARVHRAPRHAVDVVASFDLDGW
jgi:hypothetical protein